MTKKAPWIPNGGLVIKKAPVLQPNNPLSCTSLTLKSPRQSPRRFQNTILRSAIRTSKWAPSHTIHNRTTTPHHQPPFSHLVYSFYRLTTPTHIFNRTHNPPHRMATTTSIPAANLLPNPTYPQEPNKHLVSYSHISPTSHFPTTTPQHHSLSTPRRKSTPLTTNTNNRPSTRLQPPSKPPKNQRICG
jgi:hypothetical protein